MKLTQYIVRIVFIGVFVFGYVFAQGTGDYRSVASGNWSDSTTWETFDGANWIAASNAPTGSDTITVAGNDTVRVDVAVTISGYVVTKEEGNIEVSDGTMTFADGSTYEHAHDGGVVPLSTWETGSTALFTGIQSTTPGDRGQDYYNLTLNTPDLSSNKDMDLDGHTISGDLTVISSGSSRWRLVGGSSGTITIIGDVIVEAGAQLETQGTGSATDVIINHYGNLTVNGGNFSVSRGSQGSGTGTTTWNLFKGNFTFSDGQTRNSNPTPGNAKLVFASPDSQEITFTNVDYGGGGIDFKVSDSTKLKINGDFSANGLFINEGEIEPLGTLTFMDGAVYEHARDGGTVPDITWDTGSTALFTGITGSTPSNRGQDYYNLTLNTPGLSSNKDMSLDGHTIYGNITLLNSGSSRWRLVGGSSGTITIMGDVIVEDGSLETQGTSSATDVEVIQYGNIDVNGGTFAVSRGSQGSTGTTKWYLMEGNFSIDSATTRNSNTRGATFIFAKKDGIQNLTLHVVDYGSGGLPIQVDSAATLNMDSTVIGGAGKFVLLPGATLSTTHPQGLDGNLKLDSDTLFMADNYANFMFNGSEAQVPGMLLPDTIGTLTVDNPAGVSFNDTLTSEGLMVNAGALMNIDTAGNIATGSGTVSGTIINMGVLDVSASLDFMDGSVYNHARDGGDIPTGNWNEGSTMMMTGTVSSTPGNRNQSYYNLTLNTPNLSSNKDMALDDVTIGGDIKVIDTGSSRWRLTSASGGDTSIVTIMGDLIVEGGSFETQGTSNALTVFEVHQYGNVMVTGGTFAVSRGSQGNGSGSTRWFMHEGNFSIANAQARNSNPDNAWFVFDKDTVQTISLSNVTYGGGGLPIEIVNGSTLDFGMSQLGGNGLFMLDGGATLATANEGGIDSTIQSSGDLTFNTDASYTFNGTAAQVTGKLMPDTVNSLTIDNDAGVTLSKETLINGVLHLKAGVFDNTIPFTLGPDGSISYEGGSLAVTDAIVNKTADIPKKFALYQNFPNPFNPSTTIRFDVPKQSQVRITVFDIMGRQIAELVNKEYNPGTHQVTWNADKFASGIYYYRIKAKEFESVRKLILMK